MTPEQAMPAVNAVHTLGVPRRAIIDYPELLATTESRSPPSVSRARCLCGRESESKVNGKVVAGGAPMMSSSVHVDQVLEHTL
jgi:hypothetical protein